MKQLQRLLSVTIAEPLKERWPPPPPPPPPLPALPPGAAADSAFEACCYFVNDITEDAKESVRRGAHAQVREAVLAGDLTLVRALLAELGPEAELVINMAPSGSNTLLFLACELGHREMVQELLDRHADGRIHPVTRYSPLYIACFKGRKDVVQIVLKRFPELVRQFTVEEWLPVHAAAINGHLSVIDLLLRHPYPASVLGSYRDPSNEWEYEMPFDINMQDRTGQNVLYLACVLGNAKMVDMLLKFRVTARRIKPCEEAQEAQDAREPSEPRSPTSGARRISDGIHSIMSRLNLSLSRGGAGAGGPSASASERQLSPLLLDMRCNANAETALHAAARGKHWDITNALLQAGADPNVVAQDMAPATAPGHEDDAHAKAPGAAGAGGSTPLVEACRNRDIGMVDLMLRFGARDDECRALRVAAGLGSGKEDILLAKLLSIKAHVDPEFKINKKAMSENVPAAAQFPGLASLTYSSMFPNTPAMINWHGLRCGLSQVRTQWLVDAALHVNPKLKLNPRHQDIALYAITRLDLSNNALEYVPPAVLQLQSLRCLNLAQNKLERLPEPAGSPSTRGGGGGKARGAAKGKGVTYNAPCLKELYLQYNRLVQVPEEVFSLPSLVTLDVSNNQLQTLPYALWRAPKLKELNAAFNLLRDLPSVPPDHQGAAGTGYAPGQGSARSHSDSLSVSSVDSSRSSTDGCGGLEGLDDLTLALNMNLLSPAEDALDSRSLHASYASAKTLRQRDLAHHNLWSRGHGVEVTEQILLSEGDQEGCSQLSPAFPAALPCLAVNLTRLNLAYNSLGSMGYITSYPNSLKQLDLSHNQVSCWPSLPQMDPAALACFAPTPSPEAGGGGGGGGAAPNVPAAIAATPAPVVKLPALGGALACRRTLRSVILDCVCVHRRHLRLDNMRTLILADNRVTRIQLTTDDDGAGGGAVPDDDEVVEGDMLNAPSAPRHQSSVSATKARLMMPNLSMLDLSNNQLKGIPINIHELSNLSVLNISGNADVCELPHQMGLLSRLWNLNTRGCNLQEPLKSMIDSKKFKTMDVIGYLKSVLEDAKPYARMKLMIVGVQGIGKTSLLEQLRQEGGGSFRKRPGTTEHWAKRMGNKNVNTKTSRGINMSTVGVDIGDWVYEKRRGQANANYGPVVFRTWDFGGQREYYATHQYFLSKRSLYLVVWKISDGAKGIQEILQWLVNIQARAPNSPVIIVGTHYDVVRENGQTPASTSMSEDLQQMIRDKFINIVDAEKCGLPRVLDTIEVSCKTRHNIKLLCNLIYDTVFSLRPPGSKELLLEQKVPASYLMLEDVVCHLAAERKTKGVDPVLNADQYKNVVWCEMQHRYGKTFRDWSELHQATLFLHDNGVLLHYDDATLKDLYFLDPQWLCDMLAHVVTIREINPFARTGVMKLDDLKHVFKSSAIGPVDTRGYIVSLLNKFEVALTWDSRTLLIPSLLPCEEDLQLPSANPVRVKIPVRSRGWAVRSKKAGGTPVRIHVGNSSFYTSTSQDSTGRITPSSPSVETALEVEPSASAIAAAVSCELTHRSDPEASIRRLLLMSYFPSGFWSRLMTRILADDAVVDIVRSFFIMPKEVTTDARLAQMLDVRADWVLWQTGMELRYADTTLFRMKEILPTMRNSPMDYSQLQLRVKQEGTWTDVDLANSSILEIYFPVDTVVIKRPITDELSGGEAIGYQAVVLDPSPEYVTKLLALAVDHIDVLLEDWYPTLGTRFVHTSEGRFLVTRLVPCPRCITLNCDNEDNGVLRPRSQDSDGWEHVSQTVRPSHLSKTLIQSESEPGFLSRLTRKSQESSASDGDSGVGPDSTGSRYRNKKKNNVNCCITEEYFCENFTMLNSRNPSKEGHPNYSEEAYRSDDDSSVQFSWMVEECILAAYDRKSVTCPVHGDFPLAQVAPDTIFLDLGERYLIRPEHMQQGRLLGRGAFGFVFKGSCQRPGPGGARNASYHVDVAMKMLQPVQPGPNAHQSAVMAFKAAQGKWSRDPLQYATKAYCNARQELNILLSLRHPHIVPLVGVCTRPLALVLDLAPHGALSAVLRHHRRSGARLGPFALQAVILQAAKALEYLHQQHIIYRDLKSENVLVWELPPPFQDHPDDHVHIKLADYGISRLTLPSGTKGYGGTEGFMAPEIMRFNGEEEYTEKVDCFSFGMFIYELLTLHQPFEGHESVKECILEGGRPPLTYRETQYPSYMLDLMALCWSQQPTDRPSASQVVSISSAPEFTHLCDAVSLEHAEAVVGTASTSLGVAEDCVAAAWLARGGTVDLLLASPCSWLQSYSLAAPGTLSAACHVPAPAPAPAASLGLGCGLAQAQAQGAVWLGDTEGRIHAYSAADCTHLFSYRLDPDDEDGHSVCCLLALPALARVAVGLSNGRLFLVRSDSPPAAPTMAEGSFVMAELGSSNALHSLAAVFRDSPEGSGSLCELWCGEGHGNVSVYTIHDNVVTGHDVVQHPELELAAGAGAHGAGARVWSCVYPSSVVHQWDVDTKTLVNKLDCSKLVPCSESLKSISIEDHLSPGRCQVTALAVQGGELYIGTTWGCVVVAERASLRPVTVFRPFEEEVAAIVPLGPGAGPLAPPVASARPESALSEASSGTGSTTPVSSTAGSVDSAGATTPSATPGKGPCGGQGGGVGYPLVATVGKGYRSLITRYTDSMPSGSSRSSTCALLWRAQHWAVR
ncbi:Leucine-rich repeat serine/threonine-protein kinase 1 [Frankliniella fusca]|uniref:non-specific serine/threonine protein kinase n=1 Tax=Frankliniella fusca TaxID=407009 RepID=A0AAE1HI15_9NEOP|nr:Leucine-rich repeat serine/threonine-protein kinase 1 [Frankliniella fusca]